MNQLKTLCSILFLLPRRFLFYILSRGIKIQGKIKANQPVLLQGNGTFYIEENVRMGYPLSPDFFSGYCYLEARNPDSSITIGTNSFFNNSACLISAGKEGIQIGSDCFIGNHFTVMDSDFHDLDPEKRDQPGKCKGVCIGNNVFIGANVTVLKGAKIGNNSVIASGSIVTGHIPDNTVAAGNPCKIIRSL